MSQRESSSAALRGEAATVFTHGKEAGKSLKGPQETSGTTSHGASLVQGRAWTSWVLYMAKQSPWTRTNPQAASSQACQDAWTASVTQRVSPPDPPPTSFIHTRLQEFVHSFIRSASIYWGLAIYFVLEIQGHIS